MIYNLKLILCSNSSMTKISLAMSKMVLLLDEYNYKYGDYVKITTLSANTKRTDFNYGEIIIQITMQDVRIKSKFFLQLENLINTISENYKVKIKKMITEV